MNRRVMGLGCVLMVGWLCVPGQAEVPLHTASSQEASSAPLGQVIVQIGGRFCEYHRTDVEGALRRYSAVESVEFLNDQGTVLVRYKAQGVSATQLAESAAQAAFGIGCRAWVDRGRGPAGGS